MLTLSGPVGVLTSAVIMKIRVTGETIVSKESEDSYFMYLRYSNSTIDNKVDGPGQCGSNTTLHILMTYILLPVFSP